MALGQVNRTKIKMKGKRTKGKRLQTLKEKCIALRKTGLSYPKIGKKLGIHHSTAMWHCGVLKGKQ